MRPTILATAAALGYAITVQAERPINSRSIELKTGGEVVGVDPARKQCVETSKSLVTPPADISPLQSLLYIDHRT